MNPDLLLVALSLMTWGLGEGMFLNFQPLYLQQLGASPIVIGNILGIAGIAMTVAHLPAGYLADRFGRRPLLILAWLMGLTAAWIMALAPSLPIFVLGSVLYSSTTFVMAPLSSYITAARGNWGVGQALTLISATYNIGAFLGPLLGGWIGETAGLQTNFRIAAMIFIASAGLVLFIRPQPVEEHAVESNFQKQVCKLLSKRFVQFLAVIFLAMMCMFLPQPFLQNFLQNERGLNLGQIGVLIAARSLGIVILNLVFGRINARLGFLLAHGAMAVFSLLIWQGNGMGWYIPAYLLLGSYQTARSLANAQGRILVNTSNMGLAYGMIETTLALAAVLAPPVAGLLYTYQPSFIYPLSLGLIAAALCITLFFSPLRTQDLA